MWNPFRRAELKPVHIVQQQQQQSASADSMNVLEQETEIALLKSLKSRNDVTTLYERLASEALCNIKGGGICPDL